MAGEAPLLRLALLTRGDPEQRTGGHLYNRRMSAAAGAHGASITVSSIPDGTWASRTLLARSRLRHLSYSHDVVILDSIVAADCAPWLRARGAAPLVALLHQVPGGVDHGGFRAGVQSRLDLMAYRRLSRLIVVSEYLADRLARVGFDRERIAVVPPGRDLSPGNSSAPAEELRRGRALAILCVSNWRRNKGIGHLLSALARLPKETATLHLVGDERGDREYGGELRGKLATPELAGRVVVHGSLPPEQLAGLYRAADVLVHPSLHEAYGSACAEAMAAALPVIASRTDNLPYLVRDGIDGLLVEPADPEALALAINRLALDPGFRLRLAASARERGLGLPSWEQAAERFFREVRRVAGERA